MGTIGKALTLLDTIAGLQRETGLSDIARAGGLDKATARRFLVALERHGFLEQDSETRKYRIGSAPLRLAQIREAQRPLLAHAIPLLRALAARCEETVHMSEFSAGRLSTIHAEESPRANRITVKIGTLLPLHASASGMAYLAFCPTVLIEDYLARPMEQFTPHTAVDPDTVRGLLRETAARGYSINLQGLESGMISTAAPLLMPGRPPIGAVAIAAPLARVDEAGIQHLGEAARQVADAISAAMTAPARPSARTVWSGRPLDRDEMDRMALPDLSA